MKRGKCYVGTSGWSYPHWGKDRFYPKGLKPGDWLAFLSRQFGTVEVNSSFYRPPRPEMIARWRSTTSRGFKFAVKLWRRITHERRLQNCEQELHDFLEIVNGLGPKRGPLLVQLPPSMHNNVHSFQNLQVFLKTLKQAMGRTRWPVTVEFRSPDWLCESVYELMTQHDAAVCLADLPRCPITEPNDAKFVYVRRHGPAGGYRGCYTPQHITADARRIRAWLAAGKDVYVYYNNDVEGYAIDNARQLIEAIGL
jgi:uncharacterized protein YecE (DUF72 family)